MSENKEENKIINVMQVSMESGPKPN